MTQEVHMFVDLPPLVQNRLSVAEWRCPSRWCMILVLTDKEVWCGKAVQTIARLCLIGVLHVFVDHLDV